MNLTLSQLCEVMPRLIPPRAQAYLDPLNRAMGEFEINTPARMAAFLAQIAHESSQLRFWEEVAGGHAYEPSSPIPADQKRAARLGNTETGDGDRYKGRGPIQLTGRFNYAHAGRALGCDLERSPTLAASPAVGFRVAGWFWKDHGCNELADKGDFEGLTHVINGGLNGLADRLGYWATAKRVLGVKP